MKNKYIIIKSLKLSEKDQNKSQKISEISLHLGGKDIIFGFGEGGKNINFVQNIHPCFLFYPK